MIERNDSCPAWTHISIIEISDHLIFCVEVIRTVSQIWIVMSLLSITILRVPNSTPIVKSCWDWKRWSMNCCIKQDFPTPKKKTDSFPTPNVEYSTKKWHIITFQEQYNKTVVLWSSLSFVESVATKGNSTSVPNDNKFEK